MSNIIKHSKKKLLTRVPYGGIVVSEDLPLNYIYYGGHWLEFREKPDVAGYFCSCFKEAIDIFLEYSITQTYNFYNNNNETQVQSIYNPNNGFSKELTILMLNQGNIIDTNRFRKNIKYKKNICHLCNHKIPSLYSGNSSNPINKYVPYMTLYKISKKLYYSIPIEEIINDAFYNSIRDYLISYNEILKEYEVIRKEYLKTINQETGMIINDQLHAELFNKQRGLTNTLSRSYRYINNYVENSFRDIIGFKHIGEGWDNETHLFHMIKSLFKGETVIHHFRDVFLEKLELDIYIPSRNIGIEYQGIQHFKPVKHWGGQEALNNLIIRDKRKKDLCLKNKINIIYFYYYEDITEELIKSKLMKYISPSMA